MIFLSNIEKELLSLIFEKYYSGKGHLIFISELIKETGLSIQEVEATLYSLMNKGLAISIRQSQRQLLPCDFINLTRLDSSFIDEFHVGTGGLNG